MKASPPPDPDHGETPLFPPAAVAPAVEAPPTPREPPRTATWPEWFGAVDFALVVLSVVAAFLIASFAARNSDLWLQLASGRHLTEGTYRPGADPFSFSGADRPWADTSWLYNLSQYALYSANPSGQALVTVKALVVAAAFGLLFLLRRTGHAFWPWVVLIALGLLSSAPYLSARPLVWSMLFLSATLLILFRSTWKPGTWRQPLLLAGLFALWANCDGWFLLGPLTVALVLIGEKLQSVFARDPDQSDDPFPAAPPTGLLGRALVLGVVACSLNPMLLAALVKDPATALGQLVPPEFGIGLPDGASEDAELRVLTARPFFGDDYFVFHAGRTDEQIKLPSIAFAVFSLASLVALAIGYLRLRVTHVLLWAAFAGLALLHGRLIPFFTIVAAPIAAAHINGLSARIRLGTWTDTPTRLALTGSALGRLLTVVATLLMLGAVYPGWLHNPTTDPGQANRLEWTVMPEPGMMRAANRLASLRDELPDTVHGLNLSAELGNYCAWYAPRERVFVNGRFAFHRPELADLLAARNALIGRRATREQPDIDEAHRICDARKAGFLTYASQAMLDGLAIGSLLQDEQRWTLWHLDGRLAVFGRLAGVEQEVATRLKYDPVRLAFGPQQEPMPEGKSLQPLKVIEDPWEAFWVDYLARPEPVPPEVDDVRILDGLSDYVSMRANQRWQLLNQRRQMARAASFGVACSILIQPRPETPVEDDQLALSVILTRLAWRAVAASPDRPEVYQALSIAYGQPYSPTSNLPIEAVQMTEQQIQLLTALARYLARVPPPDRRTPSMAREALQSAMQLTTIYRQTGQLDLALAAFSQAVRLAESLPPEDLLGLIPSQFLQGENPIQSFLKGMKDEQGNLARMVQQHADYVNRQPTPTARFMAAASAWPPKRPAGSLPGEAIEIFKSSDPNEFGSGQAQLDLVFQLITLELRAGHLENAADDLAAIDDVIETLNSNKPDDRAAAVVRSLQGVKARLEGNFAAATEFLPRPPEPLDKKFASEILGLPVEYARLGDPRAASVLGAALGGTSSLHTYSFVVRQTLMHEATYQLERAMLALCDANIREARQRLEQAAKPQGLDLERVGDVDRLALINRYLDLIRRAESPTDNPTRP